MMPDAILLTDFGDLFLVIKAAHNCGPQNGVYKKWFVSLVNLNLNCLIEGISVQITSHSVARKLYHVIHTHARDH